MSPAAAWQHRLLSVNGLQLHAVTQGQGPLMLMLHGFPEFWYAWRYQIPVFAQHYTVAAIDLRGYNDSDKPTPVRAYAMPELVADVRGAIAALGFEHCVLVGHDWGGAIAWQTTAQHPELVDRLVILNCPHPQRFLEVLRTSPQQLWRSAYMAFFQLPWLPEWVIQAQDYRLIEQALRDLAADASVFSAADLAAFKTAAAKPGALTAMVNYYRNLGHPALWQSPGSVLTVPTLLIWGEADPVLGPELAAETERYVRELRRRQLSNCGHWVQQEQPAAVNRHMAEFLGCSLTGDASR